MIIFNYSIYEYNDFIFHHFIHVSDHELFIILSDYELNIQADSGIKQNPKFIFYFTLLSLRFLPLTTYCYQINATIY